MMTFVSCFNIYGLERASQVSSEQSVDPRSLANKLRGLSRLRSGCRDLPEQRRQLIGNYR